ncbi:hypothetical protein C4K15_5642 [Pseudomonas chlororaphis subsp. aurantiaca]|nr:hypothetical protein C4K15_5642 [Pseudomonas chlororaphis subsp. aurantiaca]
MQSLLAALQPRGLCPHGEVDGAVVLPGESPRTEQQEQ